MALKRQSGVTARWPAPLDQQFCPVSSHFLKNIGRLGLSAQEALLIIEILDHKWDEALPHPSVRRLADRVGLSERSVRTHLAKLRKRGFLKVTRRSSPKANESAGFLTNQYDLTGLMDRLKKIPQAPAGSAGRVRASRSLGGDT